jgi:tRNA 2-thiouridine synthesizing protein E
MPYTVNGQDLETDEQGLPARADFSDDVVPVIAAAEGLTLTDDHWKVVNYLRDEYREHGHTPNFRNMLKGLGDVLPGCDSKRCTSCFPPARPSRAPRWPACRSPWARAAT